MINLKTKLKNCKQEIEKLNARIRTIREERGVNIDEDLHNYLESTMQEKKQMKYTASSHRIHFRFYFGISK